MKKAVLSLSGGLDSTMLLSNLLSNRYEVRAYSFDYGQKHQIELVKVKKNIQFFQDRGLLVSHQIIDLKDCFSDSNSSLHSNSSLTIPNGTYEENGMKSTVIENRNVIFSSIIYGKALSWANKTNEEIDIYLGIHSGDHSLYPDCKPESRLACELAFKISNYNSEKVNYLAPFLNLTKGELLYKGLYSLEKLSLNPLEIFEILRNTHTCYNPNERGESCGKCGSCIERLQAFKECQIVDPLPYENTK